MNRRWALLCVLVALAAALTSAAPAAAAAVTEQVSVATGGERGNDISEEAAISGDGRYVAFQSFASNLVAGDTNVWEDVFVRDRQSGTTERVSIATGGAQGNSDSMSPSISADGRYVAFLSLATNLVAGDTNGVSDIFVHDRVTEATERVSLATSGAQGNHDSLRVAISGDGRYVAFESLASNLVADDTNGRADIFVHDRQTDATGRVSVASDGTQANGASWRPSIGADGRHVAFDSEASNLVEGDTNGVGDVFVRDRQAGATERVSIATGGGQANDGSELSDSSAISGDGRYVSFQSSASNLVADDTNAAPDVFVRNRVTGGTERVSVAGGTQANSASVEAAISADGRHVVFTAFATNLVTDDTNGTADVIVHDRQTGANERISVGADGTEANAFSNDAALSADGNHVVFTSFASNLVPNGTTSNDVYARTRAETDPPDDGGLKPAVWGDEPSFTPHITAVPAGTATFGAPLTTTLVTGQFVRAFDAVGDGSDACEPVDNASSVSGKIAVVRRGNCAFIQKAKNAQVAGAIAVVVVDTDDVGGPPAMTGTDPTIVIPAVSLRFSDWDRVDSESRAFGGTWHIGLLDITWPALFRPTRQRYDATGPSGAVLSTFGLRVVDDLDHFLSVFHISCSPAMGSRFEVGDTLVTCTVMDFDGNTGSANFTVHVAGAGEQIDDLIDKVLDLLGLPPGMADSLHTRLMAAAQAVLARDTRSACLGLQRFRSLVEAAAAANFISNADAARLTRDANRIRAVLAC